MTITPLPAIANEDTTVEVPHAPVAQAIDLSKVYGKGDATVIALGHVSVEFARGQLMAIMGPSGSGQSTLMH